MPMFRRKVMTLEAFQLREDNIEQLEKWCNGSIKGTKLHVSERCIDIQTDSGEQRAEMGDWIIKGPSDFYPCRPDVFEVLYETANDA